MFLLVGIAITIVITLYYFRSKPPSQSSTITQPDKGQISATPVSVPSDWQTVTVEIRRWSQKSDTYRFEFKAPEDFRTTKPYPHLSDDDSKYFFGAEGSGITFFAGLMEGPGPLTVLYGRAGQTDLCAKPLELQEVSKGYFQVCDVIEIDGRKGLWLIDVYIRSSYLDGTCEKDASLNVVYNLGEGESLFFTPKIDVLKEIIQPWDKVSEKGEFNSDQGLEFCPPNIDYITVKNNLTSKINSIRDAKNLSEKDNQTLQALYQMLSTVKFLN